MPPRILFLVQLPPPVHGASMVNSSIQQSEAINRAFECEFVDISPANDLKDLGKLSFGKVLSSFAILFRCIKAYFRFKPSLVYLTLSPHGAAFWKDALILQILKQFGAKAIVHLHGKGIHQIVVNSRFKQRIYKTVFRKVSVIHLSESLFSDIALVRDPDMPLFAVNNGIKDCFKERRKETNEKVNFLYLSNLVPTKGADTLIKAINGLPIEYADKFKVNFVGKIFSDSFFCQLKKDLDSTFSNAVSFKGPLYSDDKSNMLKRCDVFVLPTRFKNECFPLSILEAMSFALPVLSTFEGAIPDIVTDNIDGFLFEANNHIQLSKLIRLYIDNREKITQHGDSARAKYLEKFTKESFENNLITALRTIANET